MTGRVARAGFRAMGTTIELTGVGVSAATVQDAARRGQRLADAWERTFSRFRPDSELSRLNAASEQKVPVSEVFLAVLDLALAGTRQTAGRFDPTILPALEAAGYDRDFDAMRSRSLVPTTPPPPDPAGMDGIELDRQRRTVRLPRGVRLDLGGIAKGAFVDRLAAELADWPGGCVDAGGDLFLWGTPPSGPSWIVGIEDPARPEGDRLVAEVRRPTIGVATSGTHRRRWQTGSREANHLIDPSTGHPLGGCARSATAFAARTTAAEIATKGLLIAAARREPPSADGSAVAVVVFEDNELEIIAGNDPDACTFYKVETARRPA
jgi:thiamine biosynthesis lipoprotein